MNKKKFCNWLNNILYLYQQKETITNGDGHDTQREKRISNRKQNSRT